MSVDDLDLRDPTADPPPPSPPSRRPQAAARILAALSIIGVAVTGYFVFRDRDSSNTATTPSVSQAVDPAATRSPLGTEAEAGTIPPLDDSDDAVRELVRKLSSHPSVVAWLATDNLIRAFTAVVSNIASGEPATVHLPVLKPRAAFLAEERDEGLYVDARSYTRYTPLATAASSIDPAGAARLYTTLKPRIEDAYRELGYPDTPFDQTLERAIVLLLKTPIPTGRVPLQPTGITYGFADPQLEALTPSQKLLIRFGPDNARAVQSSLRRLALALGIPAERLP